mgnify:CR=1 FL=1
MASRAIPIVMAAGSLSEAAAFLVEQLAIEPAPCRNAELFDGLGRYEEDFSEVRGQALLALRRADEPGRIAFEDALAAKVAAERANRGQLARGRRPRVAAPVQVAEELADAQVVNIGHRQLRARAAAPRREKHQELRQVALVGADGVGREGALALEVGEEADDQSPHWSFQTAGAASAGWA